MRPHAAGRPGGASVWSCSGHCISVTGTVASGGTRGLDRVALCVPALCVRFPWPPLHENSGCS